MSNLMLGASTVFLYVLVCSFANNKMKCYFGAGLLGGLVLYTYAIAYFVMPLFMFLTLLYAIAVKKFSWKNWFAMAILMGILAFPLILVQIVNIFDLEEMRLGIFTIVKFTNYRINEWGGFGWQRLVAVWQSIFVGGDWMTYNSVSEYRNIFLIVMLLFLIGFCSMIVRLVKSVRARTFDPIVLVLGWYISEFIVLAMTEANVNRSNGILASVALGAVEGLRILLKIRIPKLREALAGVILLIVIWQSASFTHFYLGGHYGMQYYPLPLFWSTYEDALAFLEDRPEYAGTTLRIEASAMYYALSTMTPPYDINTDQNGIYNGYYYFGSFGGELTPGHNFIVTDARTDFAQLLRAEDYFEYTGDGYTLFYKEW